MTYFFVFSQTPQCCNCCLCLSPPPPPCGFPPPLSFAKTATGSAGGGRASSGGGSGRGGRGCGKLLRQGGAAAVAGRAGGGLREMRRAGRCAAGELRLFSRHASLPSLPSGLAYLAAPITVGGYLLCLCYCGEIDALSIHKPSQSPRPAFVHNSKGRLCSGKWATVEAMVAAKGWSI